MGRQMLQGIHSPQVSWRTKHIVFIFMGMPKPLVFPCRSVTQYAGLWTKFQCVSRNTTSIACAHVMYLHKFTTLNRDIINQSLLNKCYSAYTQPCLNFNTIFTMTLTHSMYIIEMNDPINLHSDTSTPGM